MAGTRTAPIVDALSANMTFKQVSIRLMDWTGDFRTDTYRLIPAVTNDQVEALVAAVAALTNATLYEVKISEVYTSVADSTNALEEVWENAKDNLVVQSKKPTGESQRVFIPAPINAMFIEQTDQIDPTFAALGTLLAAWDAAVDAEFEIIGAHFTSRRDINQQVKIYSIFPNGSW